jgi:hypothetical protein
MDLGTFLLILGLSYPLAVLWYDLLPGKLPERVWRVAAYPFLGIFVAQTRLPPIFGGDPHFGGINLITAFVGSLVAVIVDWIITQVRHPALVVQPEPRMAEPRLAQ